MSAALWRPCPPPTSHEQMRVHRVIARLRELGVDDAADTLAEELDLFIQEPFVYRRGSLQARLKVVAEYLTERDERGPGEA